MWNCKSCGKTGEEHFYKSQKWYCKSCWNKKMVQQGQDRVKDLKLEYGGKCTKCGYDKCLDALEFHHVDPTQKEFHLGNSRGKKLETIKAELDKCILVCRNCHAELHYEERMARPPGIEPGPRV